MNDMNVYLSMSILLMAVVTFTIRLLPFALFKDLAHTPLLIRYLGRYMPPAILAMLIVYTLKSTSLTTMPYAIPEVISVAAVVGLHLWKRQYLLSILGGTSLYMLLLGIG